MFRHIAAFEFRYHVKSPLFWVTGLIFGLLTFGAVTSDNIQIGGMGNVKVDSPYAIAVTQMVMCVFSIFIMTAFVANVIVRDDETGFAPIIRSTRVSKFDYLFGRFSGALAAGCCAFAVVPISMAIGSLMPWLDPEKLASPSFGTYLRVYALLCLPTLFVAASACFALATLTRSLLATYVGAVAFVMLYLVASASFDRPELEPTLALFDPFGLRAFELATKYWTATERNTKLPSLEGIMLWNRCLWFGASFLLLGATWLLFSSRAFARKLRLQPPPGVEPLEPPAPIARARTIPARVQEAPSSGFGQLIALARFDMMAVLHSPAFFVLLGIGFINSGASLWYADDLYGTTIHPVTRVMITTLVGSFSIIPLMIAIYYAGELVWRDRERRLHELLDATPAPDWAFVLPKVLALWLVLLATVLMSVLAAVAVQLIKGYTKLEFDKYLSWYVLPGSVDVALTAVLALFFQVLAPHKFVGWLAMLLFIVVELVATAFGFEHNLYMYASGPGIPLSDMNGQGDFAVYRGWFRAYWSAIAVLLLVVMYGLWRRGMAHSLGVRLRRMPARLSGAPALIGGVAVAAALGLGAFIYYNTNVLNEYRTKLGDEEWLAAYEKAFLKFEHTPQPRIVDVEVKVELFPHESRALSTGRYAIENRTGQPLRAVHVRWDRDLSLRKLEVDGARLEQDYGDFHYRIYAFEPALAAGARGQVRFETVREQVGFRNSGNDTRLVDNGTFLNNLEITPALGMSRYALLRDRAKRRKYGLPAELRMAKLEDEGARGNHQLARDSDWVTTDITLSTVADQIAIAPGYLVSESVFGGRRRVRYRTEAPILHFYSIQSAAYAIERDQWRDVELRVYYDRDHPYNIERMLRAMRASLDYFSAQFSPFQFRQMRILEFPDYEDFAQSFANTVPYSEGLGFIANYKDPEKIDMVTYVTAHEVGHQWWAHQLIGAELQGVTMLTETLAQYSALLVMEHMHGAEQIRKFLEYELDNYLRRRGSELIEELPLERVEDQPYIHYRKGALAMYLLKDAIGEPALNAALRALLQQYAFKGPPYATTRDLLAQLRAHAGPEHDQLITDLFQKITLYDVKVINARKRPIAAGQWEVSLEVEAHKLYADGEGRETETPLAEQFDVGVFNVKPGKQAFDQTAVLSFAKQTIRTGKQVIRVVTAKEPMFAGVDPYIKHIDRNSQDNLSAVELDDSPRVAALR